MNVKIFDTETTGLIKPSATKIEEQPYITEIFVLCIEQYKNDTGGWEFEIIDEFDSLLLPPVPLSAEITRITGLTDDDLKDAPPFEMVAEELAEFFTGTDRMVAHNLAFDRSMLANELVRCDRVLKFPWPRDHCCTVEKSMHIEQRRMNMQRLHEHFFGVGFQDAHRAKNDVMPLYDIYKEMVKQGMIK